jgi:hypothetical protein
MAVATMKVDGGLPVSTVQAADVVLGLRGRNQDLSIDIYAAILDMIKEHAETKKYGLAASVSGNALTISLKKSDGTTNPGTGNDALWFRFRSSTLTSGGVNFRSVTTALSLVISSGSTLGHLASKNERIYVYLIDNAGTLELAASSSKIWDEDRLQSTTAEGGAGAADSRILLYSTTARSNVPVLLIGFIEITETTPGTWASNPTKIYIEKDVKQDVEYLYNSQASANTNDTTSFASGADGTAILSHTQATTLDVKPSYFNPTTDTIEFQFRDKTSGYWVSANLAGDNGVQATMYCCYGGSSNNFNSASREGCGFGPSSVAGQIKVFWNAEAYTISAVGSRSWATVHSTYFDNWRIKITHK